MDPMMFNPMMNNNMNQIFMNNNMGNLGPMVNNGMNQIPQNMMANNMANWNNGFLFQNPMMQNLVPNNNQILQIKMETLFNEMNPDFNPKDSDKFKNLWKTKFEEIYNKINKLEHWDKRNEEEKKIIINFYDICKKEIYFDLELEIKYLISFLFEKMTKEENKIKIKYITKRIKKNQTTKYLIDNPIPGDKEFFFLDEFENPLYFEFNGKDLFLLRKNTGENIGLKEGAQIELKINNNIIKSFEDDFIVRFTLTTGAQVTIPASKNETIKSLINKFYKKCDLRDSAKKNIIFLFCAQKLDVNSDEKLEKIFQDLNLGIFQDLNLGITVLDQSNIIGAGFPMLDFVDVSSGKVMKLDFSNKAPVWRKVDEGLNIFGICNNSKCKAYKKEVVYPTKLNEGLTFNLNEEILNIKCPICQKIIKPKT